MRSANVPFRAALADSTICRQRSTATRLAPRSGSRRNTCANPRRLGRTGPPCASTQSRSTCRLFRQPAPPGTRETLVRDVANLATRLSAPGAPGGTPPCRPRVGPPLVGAEKRQIAQTRVVEGSRRVDDLEKGKTGKVHVPTDEVSVASRSKKRAVAAYLAAIAGGPPPHRPGLTLVDRAWQTVRVGCDRGRARPSGQHHPAVVVGGRAGGEQGGRCWQP